MASEGPYLRDADGNRSLDVSGSYGVNVAGYDRYKTWIDEGWRKVRDLGPVLGPLHPLVLDNVAMLKRISGQEEVSFHLSGTEAVMAAVRLARFNTGRRKIVCFSGAYHGWWDGVQPGLGSERAIDDVITLSETKPGTLNAIRARAGEIAGVLVNPVQSFHPNAPRPNDAVLLSSGVRRPETQTGSYGAWLKALRELYRVRRAADLRRDLQRFPARPRRRPAGRRMCADKWWLSDEEQPNQAGTIRSRLIKDMVASVMRIPRPLQVFYGEVMRRKHDDHVASHSHPTNQFLHLMSSSAFIACYVLMFVDLPLAVWIGVISLFVRQAGHALIEPPCHDGEQLLLGFDTRSKSWIVAGFVAIPLVNALVVPAGTGFPELAAGVGTQWFAYTCLVILGRVVLLVRRHGLTNSLVWFVKLVTDPITDIKAYYRSVAKPF